MIEASGADVTDRYRDAARIALDLATREGCRFALLTEFSPSCGRNVIYDGSFTGTRAGMGITAAHLLAPGIAVYAHTEIEVLDQLLRC